MSWKMVLLVFPSSFGSHWAEVNHFGTAFQFWNLFQFCSNLIGGHVEFSFFLKNNKKGSLWALITKKLSPTEST